MQSEKEPHLLLTNVLFSVRILISNRTVSSFIISSKQTAVFFWQSIGAALVDGIIWEFAKSAKSSKAAPEDKKTLCGVKLFKLWYFMFSVVHVTEWNEQPSELNKLLVLSIGKSWFRFWNPDFAQNEMQKKKLSVRNSITIFVVTYVSYITFDNTEWTFRKLLLFASLRVIYKLHGL